MFHFNCIQGNQKNHGGVQPGLVIGSLNDKYEQEADDMADLVMRMPISQTPAIQRKCKNCEEEELQMKPTSETTYPMLQKQEEEEDYEISPDSENNQTLPALGSPLSIPGPYALSPPSILGPSFANLPSTDMFCPPGNMVCFLTQLKLNIDDNLAQNAHHFYRVSSLFHKDPQMMENAFFRYGLGVNLLESTYSFLGADDDMVSPLSYLTGLGLKAHTFLSDGEFTFDYQIELPHGFNLEFNIGLQGDPDNLGDLGSYDFDTGIGLIHPL